MSSQQRPLVTAGAGAASLIQQLQVARVDRHGLLGVVAAFSSVFVVTKSLRLWRFVTAQ
jgi:hypothetical protein